MNDSFFCFFALLRIVEQLKPDSLFLVNVFLYGRILISLLSFTAFTVLCKKTGKGLLKVDMGNLNVSKYFDVISYKKTLKNGGIS